MDYVIKKRAVILFWLFVLVFAGIISHLAYIQVISGPRLSRQALSQQSQSVALECLPRGQILDRNLKPLTYNRDVWRAVVFPAAAPDKLNEAAVLASILKIDYREAASYFAGTAKAIPLDLNAEQITELKRHPLPGVMLSRVKVRSRKPLLASHLIGYLGKDSPAGWVGKTGIEAYYNSDLTGTVPELAARIFLDGKGRFIPGLGYRIETLPDKARKHVVLTIDRDIQAIVEKAMDNAGVKDGAAVVMDVRSGDILAMASRPDYTLDNTQNEKSFLNHCLTLYQPGSIFKVISAAAAIEEGLVKPENVFLCLGEKDDLVKCYEKSGHGLITFAQAFAYSCNPVFARLGLGLSAQKLIDYAKRFGLDTGSITGYRKDNREDKLTYITKLDRIGQPYNLVNASLGQWPVEASVVQITAMMNTIANNGVYTLPRLVREIRNFDGTTARKIDSGPGIRAVSENTAKTMQTMLQTVIRDGTGRQALIEPWGSAGKTGSAQVGPGKINAWFSGYVPADNPRYVGTILVTDGESGGKTAAPIFRQIMQEILETRPLATRH